MQMNSFKEPNQAIDQIVEDKMSKSVLILAIIFGLFFNWLALYLNVVLGLLSIGISSFVVLVIIKFIIRNKATSKNLAVVSIAYGATSAAEASVGILFLLWLFDNASTFGFAWKTPSWLLPSTEIIENKLLLSMEWIIPLLVHYFLMFIPGVTGIILGVYLAPKFIHNDEDYPFPGTIQRQKTVEVLVTNRRPIVNLFIRFLVLGFVVAFTTLFIQSIDFSNLDDGLLFGFILGTVGVTMFAVGFIVNNPKITIPAGVSSVIMYTIVSPLVIDINDYRIKVASEQVTGDFFGLYSYLMQNTYLSFLIGFIIASALLTPIVWRIIRKGFQKFANKPIHDNVNANIEENVEYKEKKFIDHKEDTIIKSKYEKQVKNLLTKGGIGLVFVYLVTLSLSVGFVLFFEIIPDSEPIFIIMAMVWILFLGSLVQGFITVSTIAKSGTAISPPFIFDSIPLFLIGARGLTPYLATPKGENRETIDLVSTLKFGQQMKLSQKTTIAAYLAGYIPAAITTPVFTLFLWRALGVGTVNFPAPGFPIFLAMIGPFAAGAIELFLNVGEMILGVFVALLFPKIGISVAIGMFFPPHMALMLMLGGLAAWFLQKMKGTEWMQDQGRTIGTALSVGATFTVPLLILMNLFL